MHLNSILDFQTGVTLAVCILIYIYLRRRRNESLRSLPPGPAKLPLIGNLLNAPTTFEWITYHKWCQELGSDIIHLDIAGKSIIVIDTMEAAIELLEKRSSIFSGRPRMTMMSELMGWDFLIGFLPYGQLWREHRRLMHQSFYPKAALRFRPSELKASQGLLRSLLEDPNNVLPHLRQMAGETIMSISYGIQVQPKDDPYIVTAEKALHSVSIAAIPNRFLVDSVPALKYLPAWMPFAGFKRQAKEWRKLAMKMVNSPYETVKRNRENGDTTPSFTSDSLEKIDKSGDMEHQESVIKGTAGTMYSGKDEPVFNKDRITDQNIYPAGSDTTLSAISSCLLGLMKNPDALKKAQEEIDRVVGPDRLPDFDDEPSLPYISALVKEGLRWQVVTPIALPHYLDVEDEYRGYRLPADSTVIANAWGILHDERVYPEPFEFIPDRFMKNGKLNQAIQDPVHAAFGFGRRICPGRYMALSSVWIAVASFVAVFNISKKVDENGHVVEPTYEYSSALISLPLPFACTINPRSSQAEALIRATENQTV